MLLKLILVLVVIAAGVYVATKYFKKFKDEDNDGIPDVVEDKFEEVKDKVEDIKEDVEDFIEEVKDVPAKLTRKKPGPRKKSTKSTPKPAAKSTGTKSGSGAGYYKTNRKAQK